MYFVNSISNTEFNHLWSRNGIWKKPSSNSDIGTSDTVDCH